MRLSVCLLFLSSSLALFSCAGQRYQRIHRNAYLVDTHNDLLSSVTLEGLNIEDDLTGKSHSDFERFRKGGVDLQVFSIFCDENYGHGTAYAYAMREIDSLYAIAARNPERLRLIKSPAEVRKDPSRTFMQGMMGVEGGHMIEDDLSKLDSFYNRGVRYMTLTWNNSTSWASSAKDEASGTPGVHHGLNDFGKRVVHRMNELGMIVDVSHVGEQTFYDVLKVTSKPILASHSSVYALCPVYRNLKDDQIRAIARNGGVIDVNFYSGFLDSNYNGRVKVFHERHQAEVDSLSALHVPSYMVSQFLAKRYPSEADSLRPPLSLLIDHINYIVNLVGVDYVGIGSDFDGIDSSPRGLDGVQDYPVITRALLKEGYNKNEIEKILGGNFLRIFEQNAARENESGGAAPPKPI